MRMSITAIGKMRGSVFQAGFDLYQSRLQPPISLREIDDKKATTKEAEGKLILAALPERATLIALDERGKLWTSIGLSEQIDHWRNEASPELAFVIGGADGLSDEILARAAAKFSLGAITLPHLLARVVLIEQIYRAQTIRSNHPYHRA